MTSPQIPNLVSDVQALLDQFSIDDDRIAVGTDVVAVSEFARLITTSSGGAFVASRFTDEERTYCEGHPERLAARWAAKEAVSKAIGSGFRGLRPIQIEVVHGQFGQPGIRQGTEDPWPDDAHLWRWSLTMSHEGDAALAIALAVPRTPGQSPPERDTRKESP